MKFIGDEQTNLDQEEIEHEEKKNLCNYKLNGSQKDPKDVGNDKNNNTLCFYVIVYYCIIITCSNFK